MVRATCVSVLGTLVLGATGGPAMAAPPSALEAPVSAAFSGLRVGSRGPDVKALQQALLDVGIVVRGGADGVFGPATRQAVIDFQNSSKLAATGEVDQATSAALAAGPGGSNGSNAPAGGETLSIGARGPQVTDVQKRLMAAGVFVAGGADGVFGPATKRAVTQFQAWNGLGQNGIVDEATSKRLGVTGAPAAPAPPKPSAIAPAPPTSNPYVGLAKGARGSLVKDLQTALQRAAIVVRGGADGVFGPATETALKSFQRANSLPESGVLSDRDAGVLKLGTAAPTPAPAPAPAPAPKASPYLGLEVGARGPAVKDIQTALVNAGVTVRGGADGVFGPATKSALRSYQSAVGVTADGVMNQPSIDKLALGTGRAPTPLPSADSAPPAAPSTNPYVGLAVGANGPLVRELQQALLDTGLAVRGGVDGVFGNATKSALVAFQSTNGGPQSGVVTEQDAKILGLGSGSVGIKNPNSNASFKMERFPVQGRCFFGDTWHAPRGGGRLHVGVDVIANEGNLLYAVVDGEISKLYWDRPGALAGNGLRVAQPDGTYFTYLHMASFAPGIELGTKVKAGDVIGFIGNTGSSATPHLHFEIHPGGGEAVNPYPFIKAIDGCKDTTPRYQSSFAATAD